MRLRKGVMQDLSICKDVMGSGTGEHDFSTEMAGRYFCYNCRKSFTAEEIDAMFEGATEASENAKQLNENGYF
jgi:hypothetical protein